jgi:hypothetical protein
MLFKRFGKDISIGESSLFKTISTQEGDPAFMTAVSDSKKKLKRKPTLFQD